MHSQLDAYVRAVEARLRSLPPADRAAELLEVTQHLEALAQAQQDAGMGEEEAWRAALSRFGDASAVGKSLCDAWQRRHRQAERRLLAGAIASTLLGIVLMGLVQQGVLWALRGSYAAVWAIAGTNFAGPLLIGFVTGTLVPRKASEGVLTWCVITAATAILLMWFFASRTMPPDMRGQLPEMLANRLLYMARWTALCLLGTWLGKRRSNARAVIAA